MSTDFSLNEIKKKYFRIFVYLLILTALTVAVTTIHFGDTMNIIVGVVIAILKAGLVMAIFMHLKFDNSRLRVFVFIPMFFFLVIVLSLSLMGL